MPRYTYSIGQVTTLYTTVTAPNEKEAERLAMENFFSWENIEEGDAEIQDDLELEDEEEENE